MQDWIIVALACVIALICGVMVGIMTNNMSRQASFPKHVKITTTRYPPINLNDPALQEKVYSYSDSKEFENANMAKEVYSNIVMNCRRCNIFFGDTRVTKIRDEVKRHDLIAVTTALSGGLYATSYERIATLHENPERTYFEMCIVANAENIIDGYYSVIVIRNGREVIISYDKVQSPNATLISMVPKPMYDDMNTKSARDTVEGLFREANKVL